MKPYRNSLDLMQIVNHSFSYTVKDENNLERVVAMKVEAANINRRGVTQLLVSKADAAGSSMQWVDFDTFNIWWQLNGSHALAS